MNKTAPILFLAVIAVSGCVSNNSDQNLNINNNAEGGPLDDSNSATTFTRENENLTMTVKAYNDTETYDITIEQKDDVGEDEYFSRYERVNLNSRIMCGVIQQVAYNYSHIADSEAFEFGNSGSVSDGLGSSEEPEIPRWVFEDFEANQVRYTLISERNSEELASCKPTEESLNLEINIEQDSENSEGLT